MLSKFFKIKNYITLINGYKKKLKILQLSNLKQGPINIVYIWNRDKFSVKPCSFNEELFYTIFGIKVNLNSINWNKDLFSNYEYPLIRFDKIKANKLFNTGIDIVFPWEQARFYYAINLAQKFLCTSDSKYFNLFKNIILDFIDKNIVLHGVVWSSTMDVAIRAVNIIVALNFFNRQVSEDITFKKVVNNLLFQHAEYISKLPAIYSKGLMTNHTIAAFTGLLFLALSIPSHTKSNFWLMQALYGLEKCMQDQIYEDGVDFEGSIPYHRLVLEMCAFSAIIAKANNIRLSNNYYNKLFKMFEFTAAYVDQSGNAPQVGDNDSGRLLIFDSLKCNDPYIHEQNHLYLISLGEHIFDHKFKSASLMRDIDISKYLPDIKKISPFYLGIKPRETQCSISFNKGGAHILKNSIFSLLVSCFPLGQNGKGGHNHLDTGSFTLSVKGKQLVVDPGTFTYTRYKHIRDKFRTYTYHNTLYTKEDSKINWDENSYWDLNKYYDHKIVHFSEDKIHIEVKFINEASWRQRIFTFDSGILRIKNSYNGEFFERLNLHPEQDVIGISDKEIFTSSAIIRVSEKSSFKISDYDYSPFYGKKVTAKCIIVSSTNTSHISISAK